MMQVYTCHGSAASWQEQIARAAGQLANCAFGLLLFPCARNSIWTVAFGVPWEVRARAPFRKIVEHGPSVRGALSSLRLTTRAISQLESSRCKLSSTAVGAALTASAAAGHNQIARSVCLLA